MKGGGQFFYSIGMLVTERRVCDVGVVLHCSPHVLTIGRGCISSSLWLLCCNLGLILQFLHVLTVNFLLRLIAISDISENIQKDIQIIMGFSFCDSAVFVRILKVDFQFLLMIFRFEILSSLWIECRSHFSMY